MDNRQGERSPDQEPPHETAPWVDVRSPDEHGAAIQLAARWAEMFPSDGDANGRAALLERFRAAHAYIDAVVHGVEPPPAADQGRQQPSA